MWKRLLRKLGRSVLSRADLSLFGVEFVKLALENQALSLDDRNLLTTLVLDRLYALPLRAMIYVDEEGTLLVNGRPLELEEARLLRESAIGLSQSRARAVVRESVAFRAITVGIHKASTPEQLLFGKAALWWGQEEDKIIALLANDGRTKRELAP